MPAEWAPHRGTVLAFPHHRTDWPGKLAALPFTFAEMARVLTQGEVVTLLVSSPAERRRAELIFGRAGVDLSRMEFLTAPTNRSWTRDSMPLFVTRPSGKKAAARALSAGAQTGRAGGPAGERQKGKGAASRGSSAPSASPADKLAVKFRFNGWARYRDHLKDDAAGLTLARESVKKGRAAQVVTPLLPDGERAVLEGGSIDVDGEGTLLTTSECLLTSVRGRYRKVGQEVCEEVLREHLGVEEILWLPNGVAGDDTSGHVDDFARFAPGGHVLVCDEPNRKDENHAPLRAAQKALAGKRDARGRLLTVVPLPMPAPVTYGGQRLPASYANFYIANAAVLVPVFNDPLDRVALDLIAACYPDRPVCPIYARDLVLGLGTLHCSTMQEPL